jgi:hypothetical protein
MHLLQGVAQTMKSVAGSDSADDLSRAGAELAKAKGKVREALQTATAKEITKILKKLENLQALTPEEKNLVGLWVVGDAEGYTKMENDFGEWRKEFRRLGQVLETYEGQDPSPPNLVEVHGVLEDAVRLTSDLANFLEKKDRVQRFHTAINNLTPDDAEFLISMLRAMLTREDL